ncbi:MAG: xanthine dehydrogenase small subunit [Myxococcota bacterium]
MSGIKLWINGRAHEESQVAPTLTLLQYLRNNLGLTGTKEGCAEGDCGACTVAVLEEEDGPRRFRAINACLILLPMMHGKRLWTVEGLKTDAALHPVQEALVAELGSQCGYCTPGVVMSMFEACYRTDLEAPHQLDDQMCGNLCRCTGYRPIRDATRSIAGLRPSDRFSALLAEAPQAAPGPLAYEAQGQHFFAPTALDELWRILAAHPGARFVAGGTDLSLEVTKRFQAPPLLVSLDRLEGLAGVRASGAELWIGATTRLSDLETYAEANHPSLARMLRYFGARQIKHRATVGGNVANASPIGDLPPVFLAEDATFLTASPRGSREIAARDFFIAYRKTALAPDEILTGVRLPRLEGQGDRVRRSSYKVSKRQELDISTVSASFWVRLSAGGIVEEARLAYGGMAATPKRASSVEAALRGQPWTAAIVEGAAALLPQDLRPISDHRGSEDYRQRVARNLLLGFFLETERDPQPGHGHRPSGTIIPEVRP